MKTVVACRMPLLVAPRGDVTYGLSAHLYSDFVHGLPAVARARIPGVAAGQAELTPLRVVAYVTRGDELLVFEHRDIPHAGIQVPAGRVDPGELLEEGLARELHEEAGIEARIVREVGQVTRDHGGDIGVYETHYFHLATDEERNAWEHAVHGKGDDAGMIFLCRFVPRLPPPQLAGNQGEFLHLL